MTTSRKSESRKANTKVKAEPAAKPAGRREKRAAHTREKLVRCALRLIDRRGLANVTVEEITEAADVGKGTFFNYFESKEQVLIVLIEAVTASIRDAADASEQGNRPIKTFLQKALSDMAEGPGKNPRVAQAFLWSVSADKQVRDTSRRQMLEGRKLIAEMVAKGQRRGEIDRKLRKDAVARQFLQLYLGAMVAWSVDERPGLRIALSNSFAIYWHAIAARGKRR